MAGFFDIIGLVGVVIILVSYTLLQTERINADNLAYSVWNLLGSVAIMSSLVFSDFNLSAFLIELFWILISVYGIFKVWRKTNGVITS